MGPNCFSDFSLRECPLFHLPLVYFFKTSNFYSNLYLSIYVCFFKVHQLFPKHGVLLPTENDVTVTSVVLQNNSAPVHARSKIIHTSKWRLARALCYYWEFPCDFSVFIMITMDGYKGRQIACLFMTWLSYASTYLLRKPLGVVSIRTLLSDVT